MFFQYTWPKFSLYLQILADIFNINLTTFLKLDGVEYSGDSVVICGMSQRHYASRSSRSGAGIESAPRQGVQIFFPPPPPAVK